MIIKINPSSTTSNAKLLKSKKQIDVPLNLTPGDLPYELRVRRVMKTRKKILRFNYPNRENRILKHYSNDNTVYIGEVTGRIYAIVSKSSDTSYSDPIKLELNTISSKRISRFKNRASQNLNFALSIAKIIDTKYL